MAAVASALPPRPRARCRRVCNDSERLEEPPRVPLMAHPLHMYTACL